MTAELVRGQNHPLPDTRLEIRVSAGHPVVACAICSDEHRSVRDDGLAHPGAPVLPGVEVPRGATEAPRFTVDLDAVPATVHQISMVLALPGAAGGPAHFGATASPFLAVTDRDGTEVASFTITGLDSETALVAFELYRRQSAWKVRAVGQGYAGGLAQLLGDQGVARAGEQAAEIQRSVAVRPPRTEPAQLRTGSAADGAYIRPSSGARPGQTPSPGPDSTVPDGLTGSGGAQSGPADAQQDDTAGAPTVPGGPIDYAHPRRSSAPPPPPPVAPAAEGGRAARPVAGVATGWS
ncbi:TerD family protein, partial [Streptomyces sp. NPDC004726]